MKLFLSILLPFLIGTVHAAEPVPVSATDAEAGLSQEFLRIRDPFKRPTGANSIAALKTPLESFQVSEFKMIAVLTGPHQTRAIVVDPMGNSFFIGMNAKIGTHEGKVIQIASDRIRVREKISNVLGQAENFDSDILMRPEGNITKPTEGR